MAIIKDDDIIGYIIGEEHVCPECATLEEQREATLDTIITRNNIGNEDRYFCDRCKKEIC